MAYVLPPRTVASSSTLSQFRRPDVPAPPQLASLAPPPQPLEEKRRSQNGDLKTNVATAPPQPKPAKVPPPSPPIIIRDANRGSSFTRVGFLGEGGFARVYEVTDSRGGRHAVKVVTKASLKTKKSKTKLYAEIKLHRALQHPNIVNFEECFEDGENVYMTLELCENGSMMDLLRRRKQYTEPETRFFAVQVIGACHYMHTHQVIHRDLKLGNLFLDANMNVKVGDFGLAALIETPGERKKTICGTPNYIAPEVLFDTANGHSFEVDTWSIGVIIYTLLVGKPPFQTKDVKTIYQRIRENKYEFPQDRDISHDGKELVSQILTPDPQQRPSLHEIVSHPFFTKGIFPPSIPLSAQDSPPSFAHVTRPASIANLARQRRLALLDEEVTQIKVGVADYIEVGANDGKVKASLGPSAQQQEREFQKAVQPGSPISALLNSARQPLLVSSNANGPRENALLRKLTALAPANGATKPQHPLSRSSSSASLLSRPQKSPQRHPLGTLHEEQEEERRKFELESQKARIVSQMAGETAREKDSARMDKFKVSTERGIDEEENVRPIRSPLKSKGSAANLTPASTTGFDAVAQTLTKAFDAKDKGKLFRDPGLDADLPAPRVFIVSWVDYCNKYGMGYALTDGSVGVHFNDSTTMIMSPDKLHFDYVASRRRGISVRKNYTMKEYPEDLKSKAYLLTHFERYMMERLYGDQEYTFEDIERSKGMDFVVKYLRMKHVIVFRMSHDTLQFNFYDHTKIILSSQGLHVLYIDKHHSLTAHTLSNLISTSLSPPARLTAEEQKFTEKLLNKLVYCKEVLQSIRLANTGSSSTASPSKAETEMVGLR